jgi:hypothetical protein
VSLSEGDAMAKRVGLLVLLIVLGVGLGTSAAQGVVSGTARDAQGQALPNARLQLRNVDTAQVVATGRSKADGAYEFTGIAPGNYVVEIVDDSGSVLGVSSSAALSGAGITGLIVSLTSTAAGGGAFFASTAGILLLVGIGAGVTATVIALNNDASPSR